MATSSVDSSSSSSRLWCHACHRVVRPSFPSRLQCPICSEGFVEDINDMVSAPAAALFLSGDTMSRSNGGRGEEFHRRPRGWRSPDDRPSPFRSHNDRPGSRLTEDEEESRYWHRYGDPGLDSSRLSSFLRRRNLRSEDFDFGAMYTEDDEESRSWHRYGDPGLESDLLRSLYRRRNLRSEAFDSGAMDWSDIGLSSLPNNGNSRMDFINRLQSFLDRRRARSNEDVGLGLGRVLGSERLVDVRDFLFGPGGDDLIQQLIAGGNEEQNGSLPASKASIEAMPIITISKQTLDADDVHCAVCKEVFEIGGEAREMPCKHIYHSVCILPWLAMHSTCPICRHEMASESSSGSLPQSNNPVERPPVIGSRASRGHGDQRGLAIIGIPGGGIHVRSYLFFGTGTSDDASLGSQTLTPETPLQTSDPEPRSSDPEPRSSDPEPRSLTSVHDNEDVCSTPNNYEPHPMTSPTCSVNESSTDVTSIEASPMYSNVPSTTSLHGDPGSGSEVVEGRPGRNFLSRLFHPSNSSQTPTDDSQSMNNARRWNAWF